jgi:hypothetical protein
MKKDEKRKLSLNKKSIANLSKLTIKEEGNIRGGEEEPCCTCLQCTCTCCVCTHHCIE